MEEEKKLTRERPALNLCISTVNLTVVSLLTRSPPGQSAVLCLVVQSYLTLCDPMDCSLPGSSVHGIVQARILEWVSMPSSRGSSQPRDRIQISLTEGGFFTI